MFEDKTVHPSIFIPVCSWARVGTFASFHRARAGYGLDKLPAHCRATGIKLIVAFFTDVSFPAVLQELLPLVLSFELPAIMQSDPNSPTVQHISQTYNLTVSFKPPTRLYRATGVVRGSQNNASAVKVSAGGATGPFGHMTTEFNVLVPFA